MSNTTFKRLIFLLAAFAAITGFILFSSGCSIQPPAAEQPKEEGPIMVGFYPSPYDALTTGNTDCNDLLMTYKGETYIASNDSQKISSYMSPCKMDFMNEQSKEMQTLVADLTSSTTAEETRLTASQMSAENGHSLIQLRNDKMNIDVFLRTHAPEMLPRAKDFDGSYDRKKLTMPIPDFVDQIAQKLMAAGYKFNDSKSGQLQFDTGSLEATSGYGTAAIMFDQSTAK